MNKISVHTLRPLENAPAPPRARRFASMMYEGVLLFAVVFIAGYAFDTLTQSKHGLTLRHTRQVWLFIAIGIYFLLCWRLGGQTLPMKAWNIKLVNVHGERPGYVQLLIRYVLMWLLPLVGALLVWGISTAVGWSSILMLIVLAPFIVFVPTWLTKNGQFLHDRLADTRLISTSTPQLR